jgi:hypothetical protein
MIEQTLDGLFIVESMGHKPIICQDRLDAELEEAHQLDIFRRQGFNMY